VLWFLSIGDAFRVSFCVVCVLCGLGVVLGCGFCGCLCVRAFVVCGHGVGGVFGCLLFVCCLFVLLVLCVVCLFDDYGICLLLIWLVGQYLGGLCSTCWAFCLCWVL